MGELRGIESMTNEDVLNDVLRKTFPNTIFIRSVSDWNKTKAIHFSDEWLNKEYSTESALERPKSNERKGNK